MEVIRGLENVRREPGASLTVGSFDGVHLGHQRILHQMRNSGHKPLTVLTFDPHPQTVVRSYGDPPPKLTTFEERINLFAELGVDRLIVARFDTDFAKITPEDFVGQILIEQVGLSRIFVGPRHGFGAGRKGNSSMLMELGKKLGFEVEVVPPVIRDGKFVSSSRIRKCLDAGDALSAWRFMGRPFYLFGDVVKGDERGNKLGFPTANLKLESPAKLSPKPGVYASLTEVNGCRWLSVSHFGSRPTFKEAESSIETHIIGFNNDIYGKRISIGLIEMLREVKSFNSSDALVAQIKIDRNEAIVKLTERGFSPYTGFQDRRIGNISAKL
ncbi:MAG: bifunctional riboflavin kinase/FAD synthetase [Candidatus Hatepunaea meridiana]|nr:bifunctional riboflavin kinase/FAD synthetase [Candidatus Hatepunaea meridiana]